MRHVKQTTYYAGHTSFSYQLLLPSGITITVQETRLETSAYPAPPPHSTAPTPSPPVHVPDVAPLTVLPYTPTNYAWHQIPEPPTHEPRLPHPTYMPQPTIPPLPLPPSQPPVPSPKPFEQPIQKRTSLQYFIEAMEK